MSALALALLCSFPLLAAKPASSKRAPKTGAKPAAAPAAPQPAKPEPAASAVPLTPLDSLVAAERAFSAMSVAEGMKPAFLANLAEDGVVFRPLPTNGRAVWTQRSNPKGTLIWEPSYAEISAAGDLGVTLGPWEFRPPAGAPDSTIAHGHFHSVWQRQADGTWRVAADIGCSHEKPEHGVGSGAFVAGPDHSTLPALRSGGGGSVQAIERAYARDAATRGEAEALAAWAATDVRYCVEGHLPYAGIDTVRSVVAFHTGSTTWRPLEGRVARSGDLGYTYGVIERRITSAPGVVPDSTVYLHVWRRNADGSWKMSLAVENPVPKPAR